MKGWEVRSFPELMFLHHRSTGSAGGSPLIRKFRLGIHQYKIGYHPLFIFLRFFPKMYSYSPPIIGSLSCLAGYAWAAMRKYDRVVEEDFIHFLRKEQMGKIQSRLSI
jgi:hypothetical protein